MPKSKKPTFRIQFHNHNKIYELYAHQVSQSQMGGFIEVGEIIFGEHSKLERSGKNRILDNDGSSVTNFPGQTRMPQNS